MHAILQAGLELFESTKGPALNLLNVVGRTAAIVVFSEVLSQIAGYYAQLAVDQGDTPEALKTWGALALGVAGPALALLGGIRNDRNGTSSTSSNVARLLMFLLTSALLIAGFVTNTLPKVFAPLAGGAVYTLVRGLLNACFPLVDKTGSPSAKAIAVTTVTYAVAQGLLDKLGQLTPLAGAARAAAGLGWSLGADAIKGLLNGFGMALDDIVYLYSKHMLPGVKPAEEEDLWVRVAPHVPSASDLADAAGNIGSMRLCAVVSFNVGLATIDSLLKSADDEKDTRWYVLTACFAILALMIYPLLVKGSASGKDDKQPLNESPIL
ncbi:hypothetical protein HNO86_19720 [Pseudomonas sp. C1C7]|uniref:hypothetical protein n=1 Tax=Pseudomonas sp. C1C7 TaxID=2735272 RepID=UPI00158645D1|nr:hypothetical protein [Pseudomonas sp. C1C7]NUT77277.1 hypothetical protein [Pseudomonas sp. C1C7]